MTRPKVSAPSTVWLRDRLAEARSDRDLDGPLALRVPIIGARLRAAREALHLTGRELAARTHGAAPWTVSAAMVWKLEKGQRTAYGRALSLARALTGPDGDLQYVLWWLVTPRATLWGRDPIAPAADQFRAWRRRNQDADAQLQVLAAHVQATGEPIHVQLPDGTDLHVVRPPAPAAAVTRVDPARVVQRRRAAATRANAARASATLSVMARER